MDTLSKRCSKCDTIKPYSDFHKNKSRPLGLHGECKICVVTRYKTKYGKSEEYVAKANAHKRAYYLKNIDARKVYGKKYYQENKERRRADNRLRRARKNAVVSEKYTKQDVLDKWGTDCHICKQPIDLSAPRVGSNGLHLDHVIPISKGGPDTLSNVKPAHGRCNISKHNKLIESLIYPN